MTRREIIAVVLLLVVTTLLGVLSQVFDAILLRLIGSTLMLVFGGVVFYRKLIKPNTRRGYRDFR